MGILSADIFPPSFIIREGIIERLKTIPTFKTVAKFARNRGRGPYQPEDIPLIACYLMNEDLSPDGDANHGEPRFIHDCKFGFVIAVQNNDNEAAEASCRSAVWTIIRMLEYQRWWHFECTGEWQRNEWTKKIEPIKIESVTRGSVPPVNFGPKTGANETPYAEQVLEMTIRFRSGFPPIVEDHLDLVHVTVGYPWPFDPSANPPFYAVYDFRSGSGLPDGPVAPPPLWPQPLVGAPFSVGALDFATPTISVI